MNKKPSAEQKLHARIRARMSTATQLMYGRQDRIDYRRIRASVESVQKVCTVCGFVKPAWRCQGCGTT